MSKLVSKISQIGFWILAATLSLSGTKFDQQLMLESSASHDYTIQVSGSLNKNFSGIIDYETAIETTSKGIPFSTLKLKLNNNGSVLPHSLEFLIARENTKEILESGTYEVLRNQDGLLNYFDGVFGFANIQVLGELPLFAKSGKIQIDHFEKDILKGRLDIELNNAIGQSVHVRGNFESKK